MKLIALFLILHLLIGNILYVIMYKTVMRNDIDEAAVKAMRQRGVDPLSRGVRDLSLYVTFVCVWPYVLFPSRPGR